LFFFGVGEQLPLLDGKYLIRGHLRVIACDELLGFGEGLVIEEELEVPVVNGLLPWIAVEPLAVALGGDIGGESVLGDDTKDSLEGQPEALAIDGVSFSEAGAGARPTRVRTAISSTGRRRRL
jgi:hypothetical protein